MTLGGNGLLASVAGLARGQVVPVDGAGVEIGAVDAGELGLAAHLDAAATTAAVAGLAGGQVVPVDGAGVELGAVDAGELGLAAHLDAAATAHAGAVDHEGVEAGDDRDVVLVRRP